MTRAENRMCSIPTNKKKKSMNLIVRETSDKPNFNETAGLYSLRVTVVKYKDKNFSR